MYIQPDLWHTVYNLDHNCAAMGQTCSTTFPSQSPIDISTAVSAGGGGHHRRNTGHSSSLDPTPSGPTVTAGHDYKEIEFSSTVSSMSGKVKNNGHALQMDVDTVNGHHPSV